MHDLRFIREDPAAFDRALERRRFEPRSAAIMSLDTGHRSALTRAQELQARRNKVSKEIGAARSKGGDASALMAQVAADKDAQAAAEEEARELGARLEALLAEIPNLPADDVPDGADETANVELRRHGVPAGLPQPVRDHVALGEGLGLMDFDRAARLSGARFVILRGALARLERALGAFMLDLHTGEFGYTETSPPILVRDSALFGTGQLPKFGADLFKTSDNYWLIPTAEVPLTNLVADEIVEEPRLPIRMTALTPCFRSEAGAAGKDTRGMIRQHQFQKVELVSICRPEDSAAEHERMTGCAEEVLKRLGLPYRVIVLCTGDMGFSARKTYDIEVWIPSEGRYREISSCSNCGDFQARRMKARYRPVEGKGNRFVHTLNGSGLAVGRTLIAVVENYQQADGSILIPEILRPYLGGQTRIGADG